LAVECKKLLSISSMVSRNRQNYQKYYLKKVTL
jgi:hypothetical protein